MVFTSAQWQGRIMESINEDYTWYQTGRGPKLKRAVI